jgi:hypothetical protein
VVGVATRAADAVAELLSADAGYDVDVTPMVVVHGARVPREGIEHRGVVFHAAGAIPRAIRGEPVIYTSAQVAAMAAVAETALPPMMETRLVD